MGQGIPYVSAKASELAKQFEERICFLPQDAGILFAGVRAEPVPGGETTQFHVSVGIVRRMEPQTIEALLRGIFGKEIEDGHITFTTKIVRGTLGAAANKALQGPDAPASQERH